VSKQRLDTLLAERGLFASRSRAAASVMAGEVHVGLGRRRAQKPGEMVAADELLSVDERPRFVSRGGIKLENALARTDIAVAGRTALDIGASTGGFTDCLLQRGAAEVIAVDVGYGELDHRLRTDPRVRVLERTNARALTPAAALAASAACLPGARGGVAADRGAETPFEGSADRGAEIPFEGSADRGAATSTGVGGLPDLAVIDVSFISLTKVLPAVLGCLAPPYDVLALVKPQFELGRERVGKGGVVRDPADRRAALVAVGLAALRIELPSGPPAILGFISSGLPGPKGNRETFIRLAPPAWADGIGSPQSAEVIERMALLEEP
jgi:23S rRNA (cytidine1920-2'-O)/16S rRNA (cytidine1409-2'-O)-methyltransferase